MSGGLDHAAAALRALGSVGDDGGIGGRGDGRVTRDRVLESLGRRQHVRRRLVIAATLAGFLSTGTLGWAWSTGRVERAVDALRGGAAPLPSPAAPVRTASPHRPATAAAVPDAVIAPAAAAVPDAVIAPAPAAVPNAVIAPAPAPAAVPDVAPAPAIASAAAPGVVAAPARRRVAVAGPSEATARGARIDAEVEALYRHAHALHFHGGAPLDALAAWDAYLARAAHGRLAVEARYNRALTLVRLGRRAEAAAALAPYADGEVEPRGYRQREATALREALSR